MKEFSYRHIACQYFLQRFLCSLAYVIKLPILKWNDCTLSKKFQQNSQTISQEAWILSWALPMRVGNGVPERNGEGLLSTSLNFCLRKELCQGQVNIFLHCTGNNSSWWEELNINHGVYLAFSLLAHQYWTLWVQDLRSFTLTEINQLWLTHSYKLKVWIFKITQSFPTH